ncbi:transferase [Pseudomonas sp. SDI]|uniref:CatB-related O-acetyltransferase n=1 Tax=Pseudomonas sp. SDI TaxID=2170734 RepID=UPI000DE70C3C|nr:CatB-related O-acetyltransferase [Pseudomonas sp. SDI]PWB34955.1 transferase [Pseudomonas sp. SDI]
MKYFKNLYWKGWIRKRDCKLAGGLPSLSRKSRLVMESTAELGRVSIVSHALSVGAHTYIRSGGVLEVVSSIGRYCSIGVDVFVGQEKATHPADWVSSHPFQFTDTALRYDPELVPATIGHDVWIGRGAMVLEGVSVGTGAIIATRALVTRDVPPYAIVAGVPAKIIRYRHSPEIIERLLASQWWELDYEWLKTLPMDRPQAFLDQLDQLKEKPKARYPRIEITQQGAKLL